MSVFIIAGKKYDTDKMTLVSSKIKKWVKNEAYSMLFDKELGDERECQLYRSAKGNFLLMHKYCGGYMGTALDEGEAKRLLMKYDYKKYEELFGEIEEA